MTTYIHDITKLSWRSRPHHEIINSVSMYVLNSVKGKIILKHRTQLYSRVKSRLLLHKLSYLIHTVLERNISGGDFFRRYVQGEGWQDFLRFFWMQCKSPWWRVLVECEWRNFANAKAAPNSRILGDVWTVLLKVILLRKLRDVAFIWVGKPVLLASVHF